MFVSALVGFKRNLENFFISKNEAVEVMAKIKSSKGRGKIGAKSPAMMAPMPMLNSINPEVKISQIISSIPITIHIYQIIVPPKYFEMINV